MTTPAVPETPDEVATPARRRKWRGRPRVEALPAGEWPELIGRLLALRGVTSDAAARDFIAPPGPAPDPYALPNLDIAIERLADAARGGERVAVYGDFDVDGVTSAAQLSEALASLGATPLPYVPDRFTEGYGLNVPAIERLHAQGATLLVTADCGTSSIDEVARARALGMDVIILDHHSVPSELPDANALVNPKLPGTQPGGMLELATAGIAFHVAAALHDALDRPFDARAYLDVAALGTVCDMAPLADENRRLLRAGLPALARTARPGLRALMRVSGVDPASVGAEDIGYRLGPRLNAAGRIEHANLALELLMTRDEERAETLALRLDELNRERQQRTEECVRLAETMIEGEPPALVMLGHADFPAGIVGIIASRLVEIYARPAVVYQRGEHESRASCRSIEEFHITDALRTRPELFLRFGGHRAAAGFSATNDNLGAINDLLVRQAEEALRGIELVPELEIDCNLPLRRLQGDEIRWLARLGPFGLGNPEPTFLARQMVVSDCKLVGDGDLHWKLKLRDELVTWPAIAFRMGDVAVERGDRVDVVYSLGAPGRDGAVEIIVKDMRPAEPPAPAGRDER